MSKPKWKQYMELAELHDKYNKHVFEPSEEQKPLLAGLCSACHMPYGEYYAHAMNTRFLNHKDPDIVVARIRYKTDLHYSYFSSIDLTVPIIFTSIKDFKVDKLISIYAINERSLKLERLIERKLKKQPEYATAWRLAQKAMAYVEETR